MTFPKPYADRVAKLRVPSGFLLAAAFVWLARPAVWSMAAGLAVAFGGLCLRAWAAGHLEKNLELARSGPYAHVRNPLYIGTLIVAAGLAIAARRWELGLLFAAVFAFVYLPVVELEEQHLATIFPEFGDYCRSVPKLIPRIGGSAGGGKSFRWSVYRRNQEYQALIGFLIGAALLVWKLTG